MSCDQSSHVTQGLRCLESAASICANVPCSNAWCWWVEYLSTLVIHWYMYHHFFEGKWIQGDINVRHSPPTFANYPWTPLNLKHHVSYMYMYQAPSLFLKRSGSLGMRLTFLAFCFLVVNQQVYGHIWSVASLPFRHSVQDQNICNIAVLDGNTGHIMVNTLLLSCEASSHSNRLFAFTLCVHCS